MPYAVITKDKPDSLDLRNEVRGVHLEFLDANQHRLLAAGAMIDDDGTGGHGGVIIVDTDERQEAEDFIANEPRPGCSRASPWCAGARPSSTSSATSEPAAPRATLRTFRPSSSQRLTSINRWAFSSQSDRKPSTD
jgi:uncharacterized protein YciI